MNPEENFFSYERLRQTLARSNEINIIDTIQKVRSEIDKFSEGAPQSDDITLLNLRFYGK